MITLVFGPSGSGKSTIVKSLLPRFAEATAIHFDDNLYYESESDQIPVAIVKAAAMMEKEVAEALDSSSHVFIEEVCFRPSRRVFWYNLAKKEAQRRNSSIKMNQIFLTAPTNVLLDRVKKRVKKPDRPLVSDETIHFQQNHFGELQGGVRKFDPDYEAIGRRLEQSMNRKLVRRGMQKVLRIDTSWFFLDNLLIQRITEWININHIDITPKATYERSVLEIDKDVRDKWRRNAIHTIFKHIKSNNLSSEIYQFLADHSEYIHETIRKAECEDDVYEEVRNIVERNFDVEIYDPRGAS